MHNLSLSLFFFFGLLYTVFWHFLENVTIWCCQNCGASFGSLLLM